MKLLGSILIVLSGLGFGFQMAIYLEKQLKEMRQWIELISLMISELEFTRRPLPEFFARLAERNEKPYARFFLQCSKNLEETTQNFLPVWEEGLLEYKKVSKLDEDAFLLLHELGESLGQCDWETQSTALKLVLKKFELLDEKISREIKDKVRLWRYLGFLVSVIMVIFLY